VHALKSGDRDEASRLNRLAIKYTALFMLPASILLLKYAGPLMRAWLGTAPVVLHVQHAFQVLLVAHAIASLAVPAAMLGRSAARPGPEAIVTALAAAIGLATCLLVPNFLSSVVVFGLAPAVGAVGIWAWITRRLGLRFGSGRDLAAAGALSVAGFAVAVAVDRVLASAGVSDSLVAVAAGMVAAMLAVGVLAHAVGLINERERSLLSTLLVRSRPADIPTGTTGGMP
jgi:O-antigen/teichoic acid export membrane protein